MLRPLFVSILGIFFLQCSLETQSYKITTRGSKMSMKLPKFEKLKAKFIPAVLGSALFLSEPFSANALSSGRRSGGSSFRSTPMRSSTRINSGGSYSYRSSNAYRSPGFSPGFPMIMPMYSPFGFSPFGFFPINLNVILLAGAAYAVYSVLSNRMGGSDFSQDSDYGTLGSGSSVLRLSISLESDWAKRNNIMETLTRISEKNGAMTSRRDLASLISETSLALLRTQQDWNGVAYQSENFNEFNYKQAEPLYQQLAIKERSKYEEEVSASSPLLIQPAQELVQSKPTQAVVSLVVAFRGKSSACKYGSVRSMSELSSVLQSVAADAVTDEGDNIMGVEVLWSPSDKSTTLSERDLIMDYPDLIKL